MNERVIQGDVVRQRDASLDYMRVFAFSCVILWHATGWMESHYSSYPVHIWFVANIYNSFVRYSVPLFIMISGALLLSKEEAPLTFYKKRMNKVLLPYIVWCIIYLYYSRHTLINLDLVASLKSIALGTAFYHLWFIYLLLQLYLITPLLRPVIKFKRFSIIFFTALFIIAVGTLFPFLKFPNHRLLGFAMYFMLGYYLNRVNTIRFGIAPYIVFSAAFIFTVVIFYIKSSHGAYWGSQGNVFLYDTSPNIMVMAACMFIIFKNIKWKSNAGIKLIAVLSYHGYLAHAMVMDLLSDYMKPFCVRHPVPGFPAYALVTLSVTLLLVYIYTTLFSLVKSRLSQNVLSAGLDNATGNQP